MRFTFFGWTLALGLSVVSGVSAKEIALAEAQPPTGWTVTKLPGSRADVELTVLKRSALASPERYSVVVVPGSGCTGWFPVANRYFAGLLHSQLLVLHKPGVDAAAGFNAVCDSAFVQNDTLSAWRNNAKAAIRAFFAEQSKVINRSEPQTPVLLVGISEGAELLPDLAHEVPYLAGVVMISAPGLDPIQTGELQARRMGHESAWLGLERIQGSNADDHTLHQGRTLAYWRDFWRWNLEQPLLDGAWPLLRVWGSADALVPELAYQLFTQKSSTRSTASCQIRLPDADHGLQSSKLDGLQWLWARIEIWARNPEKGLCEIVPP